MRQFFARLAISIAGVLVALVAAFVAIGFFALALYQFVLEYLSPALAALATGFIILAASMLLVIATKLVGRKPKRRKLVDDPAFEAATDAAELGSVLGRKIQGLMAAHNNSTLWAALAAGFAVGVSPKLRAFLLDLLKR